ncbi:MAG: HAD family hydrolase [Gemmataceae bacterium]|nr:HAD family hydrolase [Gemmataceae bacterium]
MKRCYVLLDRDGTINVDRHYLADPDGLELLPHTLAGLQKLVEWSVGLVVVTNQSGIARGYFDQAALDAIHDRLRTLLARGGVALDGIYYCPHAAGDACDCRKPKPGLALRAAAELGFDLRRAFVIGDKPCDIELGRNVGATTILVRTGYGAEAEAEIGDRVHHVATDLWEAAHIIDEYRFAEW